MTLPQPGGMRRARQLFGQRAVQVRVTMPVDIGPDRGVRIQIPTPVYIPEPTPLPSLDMKRRQLKILLHLGEGMPRMPTIEGVILRPLIL